MPITYEIIASQTISSSVTTITFSSIPQTYTDLRAVLTNRPSATPQNPQWRLNNDSGTNYTRLVYWANGAGTYGVSTSYSTDSVFNAYGTFTTNASLQTLDIFDYTATNHEKGMLFESTSLTTTPTGNTARGTATWFSTAAVTSLVLLTGSGNFNTGTVVALYGIKRA
jgi:hypothetical protein